MSEYKLVREIGRGGMGSVWYGLREDGTECAIKCMLAKYVSVPDYREFFDSEAKAMKRLNHPSVVRIMGNTFTDASGNLYLPMEYVQGETIEQHVKRTGTPFSEQEAISIMADILDAFTYIHAQGQIHRDIKPSNIILRPNGSICVIDFGIAKDMKTSTGKTVGRQVGTSGYMSPEQISALNIDHRTDIYSLGCLLFYMLAARHAIVKRANDYETMYAIQKGDFPSVRAFNQNVSSRIENVIYKATDKDMRCRYQSAEEFKKALACAEETHQERILQLQKYTGRWQVTVGRTGQDVNIPNQYVSSSHLDIELEARFDEKKQSFVRNITITDHSTNGTGIEGRYLHNAQEKLVFDPLDDQTPAKPEVLLAGRDECKLDWEAVQEALWNKMSNSICPAQVTDVMTNDEQPAQTSQPTNTDKMYVGIIILSFFLPIVGWIFYGVEKNNTQKAKQAFIAAWVGLGVGMLFELFLLFLAIL